MANPQAFDPDAFLAQTAPAPAQGGFDPDAFLASTPGGMIDVAQNAVGAAFDTFKAPYTLAQKVAEDPQKTYEVAGPWLPAAGGAIGTAFAPVTGGMSIPIGAGIGELARQGIGVALDDPKIPREPWPAAREAMIQTATAGIPEVNALLKGPAKNALVKAGENVAGQAKPYVQRGLEFVGEKLKPVAQAGRKFVASATETMTGVPARNVQKLIDDPLAQTKGVFQMGKLGKAVEEAESVSTARVPPLIRSKIITNEKGSADELVSQLLEAKYTGAPISPQSAEAGILAIDRSFPPFTDKNAKIIREYSDLRSKLSDIVAEADPNLGGAKRALHEAKVGEDFRRVFRRNKNGSTSAVQFLIGLANPANIVDTAKKLPFFSPALYGAGISAGSIATEAAKFGATNPTVRQALISRWIVGREGADK